jgi:hypothetical protein
MQHRPEAAPKKFWLERWINWLPVERDREESANCYSFVAHILENGSVSAFIIQFLRGLYRLERLFQRLITFYSFITIS